MTPGGFWDYVGTNLAVRAVGVKADAFFHQ